MGGPGGPVPPPPVPLVYDAMGALENNDWLNELMSRGAKIVRVLFPRTANNDKELTVVR